MPLTDIDEVAAQRRRSTTRKQLRESGAITQGEFDAIKAEALA
jgi:hypothetical protein